MFNTTDVDISVVGGRVTGALTELPEAALVLDRFSSDGVVLADHAANFAPGPWLGLTGAFETEDGQAVCTEVDSGPLAVAVIDTGHVDVSLSCRCRAPSAGTGIAFRVKGPGDFFLAYMHTQNFVALFQFSGGTGTEIQRVAATVGANSERVLAVDCAGPDIDITLDGQPILSYGAVTVDVAATRHGLYAEVVGSRYDNFQAERA